MGALTDKIRGLTCGRHKPGLFARKGPPGPENDLSRPLGPLSVPVQTLVGIRRAGKHRPLTYNRRRHCYPGPKSPSQLAPFYLLAESDKPPKNNHLVPPRGPGFFFEVLCVQWGPVFWLFLELRRNTLAPALPKNQKPDQNPIFPPPTPEKKAP